jgi:flagellar basal-body rod protein FlgB
VIEALFSSPQMDSTKKMLEVALARHEALASNIANVETPGYRRVDLSKSFSTQLNAELVRGGKGLAGLKPAFAPDDSATVRRADGNTVQLDQELLEMAGNTTNVEVLSQFVSGSLRQLRTAVLGRNV